MDPNIRLSANFTLHEFLVSQTAQRNPVILEEQMNPPEPIIGCLQNLVTNCIQVARSEIGFPILVNSGWRCLPLNRAVGSRDTSQHPKGMAADLTLPMSFLTSKNVIKLRNHIDKRVKEITCSDVRPDVNANYYLWAYMVLNRDRLRIDQVIHEFGYGPGNPGWIHVSSVPGSKGRHKMTALGKWVTRQPVSVEEALGYGT